MIVNSHDKKFHFGDVVATIGVSIDNPIAMGTFVRVFPRREKMNPGTYGEVTDGNGHFWEVPIDSLSLVETYNYAQCEECGISLQVSSDGSHKARLMADRIIESHGWVSIGNSDVVWHCPLCQEDSDCDASLWDSTEAVSIW